jgi:hypothetical protein
MGISEDALGNNTGLVYGNYPRLLCGIIHQALMSK